MLQGAVPIDEIISSRLAWEIPEFADTADSRFKIWTFQTKITTTNIPRIKNKPKYLNIKIISIVLHETC